MNLKINFKDKIKLYILFNIIIISGITGCCKNKNKVDFLLYDYAKNKLSMNLLTSSERKRFNDLQVKADEFFKFNEYYKAIENYEKALLISVTPDLYYNYGVCLTGISKYDEALKAFYISKQLNFSKTSLLFYEIAKVYACKKRYKEAYKYLTYSVIFNFDVILSYYNEESLTNLLDDYNWGFHGELLDDANTFFMDIRDNQEFRKKIFNEIDSLTIDEIYIEYAEILEENNEYYKALIAYHRALMLTEKKKIASLYYDIARMHAFLMNTKYAFQYLVMAEAENDDVYQKMLNDEDFKQLRKSIMWYTLNLKLKNKEFDLIPFIKDDKYGYKDRTGKIIIKPDYTIARLFHEDLAAVKIGDNWGFINKKGRLVIPPEYFSVTDFGSGLAGVVPEDQDCLGYIDKTGYFKLGGCDKFTGKHYVWVSEFYNGRSIAQILTGSGNTYIWILIDRNGYVVKELKDRDVNNEVYQYNINY